jgi:hypothetical protein
MPTTYEPIATQTLASAAASITFSSISSAYTDLRLVIVLKATSGNTSNLNLVLNSDTGTNYSYTTLRGDGTSAFSNSFTNNSNIRTGSGNITAGNLSLFEIDLFSYAGSTFKTVLLNQSVDLNGSGQTIRSVNLWRSTSAVNRIDCNFSNNGDIGTTATLYGIKNV